MTRGSHDTTGVLKEEKEQEESSGLVSQLWTKSAANSLVISTMY